LRDIKTRIVHISDTHISPVGQFKANFFDKAVKEIDKLDPEPSMLIHTGDLTDWGILEDYELATKKIQPLPKKRFFAPGNHDERNYGQELFKELLPVPDFEAREGDVAIYVMNSPEPDRDEGRLGRRRQDFLAMKMKDLPKDMFKIVAFHHHVVPVPYSGRETNVLEDAGDVLELLLRNNVQLVLMGHRHVQRAIKIENTLFVNAGTLSCVRTRARLGNSFNVIDIAEDGTIDVQEVNLTKDAKLELFKGKACD
jgi:3',5'-cyclic AMP phosphodiesterase CpdA